MTNSPLRVFTRNVNGAIIEKLPFIEGALCSTDVLCLQEHFLTSHSVSLLKYNDSIRVFAVPAVHPEEGGLLGALQYL